MCHCWQKLMLLKSPSNLSVFERRFPADVWTQTLWLAFTTRWISLNTEHTQKQSQHRKQTASKAARSDTKTVTREQIQTSKVSICGVHTVRASGQDPQDPQGLQKRGPCTLGIDPPDANVTSPLRTCWKALLSASEHPPSSETSSATTFCVALPSNSKWDYIHKKRQREGQMKGLSTFNFSMLLSF